MRVTDAVYEADQAVPESEARSLAVAEVIKHHVDDHLDGQRRLIRNSLKVGGSGVILGLLLLASMPVVGSTIAILGGTVIGGGTYYARSRDPDVTVDAVHKGYWTGHLIQDGDDITVYDATASVPEREFDLERLSDRNQITAAHGQLTDIEEFPIVMPASSNVEEQFTQTLESVQTVIDEAEQRTVSAPVIRKDSDIADGIETLAEQADAPAVDTNVEIDQQKAIADIEKLVELEELAAGEEAEAELTSLNDTSRRLVGELSGTQETAIDLLNDHIQTAADAFGAVSYQFYCPECQTDGIESPLELDESADRALYCETCRTRHTRDVAVPRHKIKDEIVNPVWDQLWREKDDERRRIYEEIEDQKAELREREFEQRSEEIRTATDRIRDLRSKIRNLKTEAKAAQGTVDEIGDLMVKYDRLKEQRKEEFHTEIESKFSQIDEKTEKILEETRNEEQERLEQAENEAEKRAEMIREEERKREQAKFIAEQQLENQRLAAELEQEEDFHRDELLLETRGELSLSNTINNAYYWKAKRLGASAGGGEN